MTDFEHEQLAKEANHEKKPIAIERFYKQISSVPQWIRPNSENEDILLDRFKEVQNTALTIIHQFNQDKQHILKDFNTWLLPMAKEVLEEMTQHAEKLGENLQRALQQLEIISPTDWQQHAKQWASLYAKWYDPKHFTQKILQLVSQKADQLIEKDIKVIDDYQTQSLIHLPPEEYEHVQARLQAATAESLKALQQLKQSPRELSLKQAAEWMAQLHKERETHFDELLMRIDQIIKEVVQPEHASFASEELLELEGEINFTEHELKHLAKVWRELKIKTESDKEFMVMRLDELEEHLDQFDFSRVPAELKRRVDLMNRHIQDMRAEAEMH